MYTVNEIVRHAHITVKALHHYHKIGLLVPVETTEAGYRSYGKKKIERLQEILFYKELDFSLQEIKDLLNNDVDRKATLIKQKSLLEQMVERYKELIKTINFSIKNINTGEELEMEKMFKGFETATTR